MSNTNYFLPFNTRRAVAVRIEYVCPACGGSGEVYFGPGAPNGQSIHDGMVTCGICSGKGLVTEQQVYRHRLIVLAGNLAQRAVAVQRDTPSKLTAFTIEGKQYDMGVENYTKVKEMEAHGLFEFELWKLRHDLVETLFDLLAVPKPERFDNSCEAETD